MTVLPTPAPPKRPTLPPLMYGAIRSMTLIPVSKTSTDGCRSRNAGGSRWIDQRSTSVDRGLLVDRLADHVPDAAERRVADGDRDRPARVDDVRPTRETVGRVHGDRAHAVVAEVLLHLRDERRGRAVGPVDLDLDGVEDLGQAVGEDRVDHDALDLDDLAGVGTVLAGHGSPESSLSVHGVSAVGYRTGAAWKSKPATCVKKCRSDARQAAVAYRIPAHRGPRGTGDPRSFQPGRNAVGMVECSAL